MRDSAIIKAEYTTHMESENTVQFITGETPDETLTMDYRTWAEMGFPHFVTITVSATKA